MKYIIYFALGALAVRLLDTLWQMVVGTPVPEFFIELDDLPHTCGECGEKLQIVRPGKYQCNCEPLEFVVEYEGGGETTITPPWFYEIFWN